MVAAGRQAVTLHRVLVRVLCDVSRHAGHADVLRELHDGAAGWHRDDAQLPGGFDWQAYVARLRALADGSADRRPDEQSGGSGSRG